MNVRNMYGKLLKSNSLMLSTMKSLVPLEIPWLLWNDDWVCWPCSVKRQLWIIRIFQCREGHLGDICCDRERPGIFSLEDQLLFPQNAARLCSIWFHIKCCIPPADASLQCGNRHLRILHTLKLGMDFRLSMEEFIIRCVFMIVT